MKQYLKWLTFNEVRKGDFNQFHEMFLQIFAVLETEVNPNCGNLHRSANEKKWLLKPLSRKIIQYQTTISNITLFFISVYDIN